MTVPVRRPRRLLVGAVAVLALSATGCTAPTPDTAPTPTAELTPTGAAPSRVVPSRAVPSGPVQRDQSTSAPEPTPGDVDQTVPARPVPTSAAVPLGRRADAGQGAAVRVVSVRRTTVQARLPGEVSGPAVSATVAVTNRSRVPLDLGDALVTLTGARGRPGAPMSGSPARDLPSMLKAGRTARGTFVFAVPTAKGGPVSVRVSLEGDGPVLLYEGKLP